MMGDPPTWTNKVLVHCFISRQRSDVGIGGRHDRGVWCWCRKGLDKAREANGYH